MTGFSVKRYCVSALLAVALQLCPISISYALESEQLGESVQHETVVVVADRRTADSIDTSYQTGRVTVITSEEFAGEVATVADVLRNETAVQIRQVGGLGSFSTVSIRGSTGAQVNVYLDGVLVNDAYGGSVDLSQFLLSAVESIEIYRGNTPVQLGASNIGGSIHIKTKRSNGAPENHLSLGYGSFKTRKASLAATGGSGATSYLGSIEYLDSDNDYEFLNNNQTEFNPNDDRVERRQNAQFDQLSALLSMNHALNDKWQAGLVAQYSDKSKGIPDVSNSQQTKASFDSETANLQIKFDQSISSSSSASYQVFTGRWETLYDDSQSQIGLGANLEEATSQSFGFKADYARGLDAHLLNVTGRVKLESYENHDLISGAIIDAERLELASSAQDEWLNARGDWMLSGRAGLRMHQDERVSGVKKDETNTFLDAHLGARHQLLVDTVLLANVSRDIRAPSLLELFGDQGSSIGNESLVEEQALSFDFGVQSELQGIDIAAVAFYRSLKDAIVTIYDARGIGRAENISKARIFGFELEASRVLNEWWQVSFAATLQETEDLSDIPSFKGNPLPGQYDKQASIKNTFRWFDVKAILEFQHRSGGNYDRSAVAKMPTHNQVHLSFDYVRAEHHFELALKNLSDERIEDFNRYPGPGRSAFFTYGYTF